MTTYATSDDVLNFIKTQKIKLVKVGSVLLGHRYVSIEFEAGDKILLHFTDAFKYRKFWKPWTKEYFYTGKIWVTSINNHDSGYNLSIKDKKFLISMIENFDIAKKHYEYNKNASFSNEFFKYTTKKLDIKDCIIDNVKFEYVGLSL